MHYCITPTGKILSLESQRRLLHHKHKILELKHHPHNKSYINKFSKAVLNYSNMILADWQAERTLNSIHECDYKFGAQEGIFALSVH